MFQMIPRRIPASAFRSRVSSRLEPPRKAYSSPPIQELDYGTIWFLEVDSDTGKEWLSKEIDRDQVLRKAASAALDRLAFYGPGYGETDWMWSPHDRLLTVEEEERRPMQWRLRGRNVKIPGTDVMIDGEEEELEEGEGTFDSIKPYMSPVTF